MGAEMTTVMTVERAMIRSVLDYGCVVYGSAAPKVLARLDVVQFKALRL